MRAASAIKHRSFALLLAGMLLAGAVGFLPAAPAAASSPSVSLAVVPTVTTVASHDRIEVRIGYQVSDAALQDGQIRVELPKSLWTSSDLVMTGGTGRTLSAVDPNHVLVWDLGTQPVSGGNTYEVEFTARTLHTVLPHGTQVSVVAAISGSNLDPVVATSAPVTLTAQANVAVDKTADGAAVAYGPAGTPVAGQLGFDVRYRIRPSAVCTTATIGSIYPVGCQPAHGTVTDTLPPGGYLASVRVVQPTPTALNSGWDLTELFGAQQAPFDLVGSSPPNLATQPSVVSPGSSFSIPTVLHSRLTRPTGDGHVAQGSAFDQPCGQSCPADLFNPQAPPELEVVVWVPQNVAPSQVINQVDFDAADGHGGTVSDTDTATQLVTTDNALHLDKWAALCTGGHVVPGTNRPAQACMVPYHGPKLFGIDLSTTGSVVDPVVTDSIPGGLVFDSIVDPPNGWTTAYAITPGCDETTPANAFSPSLPTDLTDITCVRWSHPGAVAGNASLRLYLRRDPSVTLPPGAIQLVTNVAAATSANAAGVDAERPVWLAHIWEGGVQKVGPATLNPGVPFQYRIDVGDRHLFGDVGPTDLVVEDVLPAGLDYLGHSIAIAPAAHGGGSLPVACNYTPSNRVFRCEAPGRAADRTAAGVIFRVWVDVELSEPVSVATVHNQACGWADATSGPVDNQGVPLTWYVNAAKPSCATTDGTVHAVVAMSSHKHLISPSSGPVEPGDVVTYGVDYGHVLPDSTMDLHNGYLYDFLGRHPLTGTPIGTGTPEFVSASVGDAAAVEYTCDGQNLSVASASTLTWVPTPTCGTVTGLRWRLPSPYARTAAPGSVVVSVRVPLSAPHSSDVVNQSAIVGDSLLPAATSPVGLDVIRPTDLSIDKSHAAGFGENPQWSGTWTLLVANQGPHSVEPADTITVADTLPTEVTPISAGGTGWSCTTAGQLVTCDRTGPLAVGASFPPIEVEVAATAGTYANTAAVTTTGHDPDPNNDTDTDVVSVAGEVTARAWGLVATLPLLGTLNLGDTGEVVARDDRHVDENVVNHTVSLPFLPPLLSARLVSGVVDIDDGPQGQGPWTGDAEGLVDRVAIRVAGVSILAEDVVATSHSSCGIGQAQSTQQDITIGRLVVNGQAITLPNPAPNTTLSVGVATITLNERAGGAVTAIRIQVLGIIDVRIAYARSTADCG